MSVLDPATVGNAASWELRRAGRDNLFDTADDVLVPISMTTKYMIGTNRLSFSLSSTLFPGRYQFRAYSGGLRDPFGQPLDGNGDSVSGDPLVRNFTVSLAGNIVVRSVFSTPANRGGDTVTKQISSAPGGADVMLATSSATGTTRTPRVVNRLNASKLVSPAQIVDQVGLNSGLV